MFLIYAAWKKPNNTIRTALIDFGPSWPEVCGKVKRHNFDRKSGGVLCFLIGQSEQFIYMEGGGDFD